MVIFRQGVGTQYILMDQQNDAVIRINEEARFFFLEETNNFPGLRAGGENELQRKGRAYLDSYFEKLSMDRKC